MDYQVAFNVAISLVAFLGGWVLNNITKSLDRLDKDVRDLPHTYVSKEDYKDDLKDIKDMLNKIFSELKDKVDK